MSIDSPLYGKHVVLGISGGIAAYKSAVLARLLVKAGAEVQVIMTPSAREFITPLTMSTLTGKPVISEFSPQTPASGTATSTSACGPIFSLWLRPQRAPLPRWLQALPTICW